MATFKTTFTRAIPVIPSDTVNIPNPAALGSTGSATETVPNAQTVLTSGPLVVGVTYEITDYIPTDDFTNVGATDNKTGIIFEATGDTPTDWTNGSELTDISSLYGNYLVDANADFTSSLIGSIVVNTTTNAIAYVVGFTNSTSLQLSDDIFSSGDDYAIYTSDLNQGCYLYIPQQTPDALTILTVGGDVLTLQNCGDTNASYVLPINILKVLSTNTNLTNLVALW